METFTAAFLSKLAAGLSVSVLGGTARRLRLFFAEPERGKALGRCARAGVAGLLAVARPASEDEARLLADIFERFFCGEASEDVGRAVADLLTGQPLDTRELELLFDDAGYEAESLPGIDLETAFSALEKAFAAQAAREPLLQGEIRTHAALDGNALLRQLLEELRRQGKSAGAVAEVLVRLVERPPGPNGPPASLDAEKARTVYLDGLRRRCLILPLAALGGKRSPVDKVTLDQVYVELDTETPLPEAGDDEDAERRARAAMPRQDRRRLPAFDAAVRHHRLVLLGDPGSGKTSFGRQLLARQAAFQLGVGEPIPEVGEELLPILVGLQDLAATLSPRDLRRLSGDNRREALTGKVLSQADAALKRLAAGAFSEGLAEAFRAGRCLLVMDGLDEVSDDRRAIVLDAVLAVVAETGMDRVLVTCRRLSYGGEAVLPGFEVHTLAPLDPEKIRRFAAAWYGAQEALPPEEAKVRADDLGRVASGDLRELGENPMLLTSMALLHQKGVTLPPQRVVLYHDLVELLSTRWQKHRSGEATAPGKALSEVLKDPVRLWGTLERLAYEAHGSGGRAEGGEEREPGLDRGRALAILEQPALLGSPEMAAELLDYADRRAGVVVGRGGLPGQPSSYAFPHRTLQEYLAGCHLATQGERQGVRRLWKLAAEGDTWTLAVTLAAEELHWQRRGPATLAGLAYHLPRPRTRTHREHRAALWSGIMAALLGPEFIDGDDHPSAGRGFLRKARRRLARVLEGPLGAAERFLAGETLSTLGDPRDLERMLPVPAGEFPMGGEREEEGGRVDRIFVDDFRIGEFPVTQGAYVRFVEATGHPPPGDWKDGRPAAERLNQPVVGVSWHDARAYCAWLSAERGETVRLPTEAEWEKAARGEEGRVFPWGDEFRAERCNTAESGLGRLSAVGMYTGWSSPCGAQEMAGNVWEWTGSLWGEHFFNPEFAYPYRSGDGRESLGAPDEVLRVLRGGSFYNPSLFARCAFRLRILPGSRDDFIGFRVVSPGL